jgi:GTP cyclohydrolase IA
MIGIFFDEDLYSEEARRNTPRRVDEMMREFAENRNWDELEECKGTFPHPADDLIVIKEIPFNSWCEHHVMSFQGVASVAYLPGGYIVGLSKINRTVLKFASRPQLQERLTSQIADYLSKWIPRNAGVMVYIEANHTCVEARGVKGRGLTCTSAVRGAFLEKPHLKAEALSIMGL